MKNIKKKIRIIIADDDPIILTGLSMIIEAQDDFELLETVSNGFDTVDQCREKKPDVVLLDIRMPGDGIETAEAILREGNGSPLLLTTFDEPALIKRALDCGVKGYILKNSPADRICSAIRTVAEGGTVFGPDILDYIRTVVHIPQGEDVREKLTPREQEIAALVAEGLSNAGIAERLIISNGTVRNHISVILEKLGLEHRTQIAVRYWSGK
jgi:DNA-binding NarL/FixJ family response regulator